MHLRIVHVCMVHMCIVHVCIVHVCIVHMCIVHTKQNVPYLSLNQTLAYVSLSFTVQSKLLRIF